MHVKPACFRKFFTALIASLSIGFASLAESGPDDTWENCSADDSCTIEYEYLSTQKDDPFLFLGLPMNQQRYRWKQYRNGILNFPDVRDCLSTRGEHEQRVNLLKIDWDSIGAGSTAEVCLFRIFRSLRKFNRIQEWLAYHEFKVGEVKRFWSEKYVPEFETQPISRMTAIWTVQQYREVHPSLLRNLTGFDLVSQFELVLGFSADGEFVEVQIVIPSKKRV